MDGLKALDKRLSQPVSLVIGGGGAMILAHSFPLVTYDIDAVPKGISMDELSPHIEAVAKELKIPVDWLNPWYSSFTYVLPGDYEDRLIEVYKGKNLVARALGVNDLLIMKCFAHRQKDISHVKALLKAGADADFAYKRMEELEDKGIPHVSLAQEFLDEVLDQEEA